MSAIAAIRSPARLVDRTGTVYEMRTAPTRSAALRAATATLAALVFTLAAPAATAESGSGGGGTAPAAGATFRGLGQLPGGQQSYAYGVSGDGNVVVGTALNAAGVGRAYRWTTATGMQDLGDLGGGGAVANAASRDGSVVAGRSYDGSGFGQSGFRWTVEGGMEKLPIGEAVDVSADGNAAVGFALLWTAPNEVTQLPGYATGISPENVVVVGYSGQNPTGRFHAYRWTQATGMKDLGTLSGAESVAEGTSANGAVVVGQAQVLQSPYTFWHAFRWTAARGMEDLKTLGGPQSAAYEVSNDGSVIVGKSLVTSSSASERAFRWTAKKQMQDLRRELLDAGVTAVQNWVLFSATGVNDDGTVIVGYGLNPSRQWEAFRAVLPVPG